MKKIIIANWKMNPRTSHEAEILARNISIAAQSAKNLNIFIAPPFIYLPIVQNVRLGSQDVFWENTGYYTGEISPLQLKASGVSLVIVGHSERRALGETNEEINKKIKAVLGAGMKAVLCVGEKERQKETAFPPIIQEELKENLKNIKKSFLKNLIIAYEPIWAISTNKSARPDKPKNVFEITVLIRKELLKMFGKKIAFSIPILYGGSVDEKNVTDFVETGKVDGFLVGSASLNAKKFTEIIKRVLRI